MRTFAKFAPKAVFVALMVAGAATATTAAMTSPAEARVAVGFSFGGPGYYGYYGPAYYGGYYGPAYGPAYYDPYYYRPYPYYYGRPYWRPYRGYYGYRRGWYRGW